MRGSAVGGPAGKFKLIFILPIVIFPQSIGTPLLLANKIILPLRCILMTNYTESTKRYLNYKTNLFCARNLHVEDFCKSIAVMN